MVSLKKVLIVCGLVLMAAGCQSLPGTGAADDADKGPSPIQLSQNEELRRAAELAQSKNDFKTAAGYFQRLLQSNPDDVAVRTALAKVLRYDGQAELARNLLNDAPAEADKNPLFLLEAGKVAIASDRPDEAEQHLNRLSVLAPSAWESYAVLGIAYDVQGKFGAAKASYLRALELEPNNASVLNNYALSRAQAGDIDAAVQILEKALATRKGSVQIRQNLALFYGIRGDLDHARALARMDLDETDVTNNLSFYNRFQKSDEEAK